MRTMVKVEFDFVYATLLLLQIVKYVHILYLIFILIFT